MAYLFSRFSHFLVHIFSNRHVCLWRHFLAYLFSRFPHFFYNITKIYSSYYFGGTRSVLSWETIVHYHRYILKGQIRFKDTTFFVGLGYAFYFLIICLHCRFVSFIFFCLCFLNEHGDYRVCSRDRLFHGTFVRTCRRLSCMQCWCRLLQPPGEAPRTITRAQPFCDLVHGIYQTVFREPFHASPPFAIECTV